MGTAMLTVLERSPAMVIGYDTVAILRDGHYTAPSGRDIGLRAALDACRHATIEYPPDREPALTIAGTAETRITVVNDTVLAVGRRMADDGAVAALSFASATSVGGGFLNGARAQEQSIARSSGLFSVLEGRAMYRFHRAQRDAMHSDYVIYSPDVPVFRTDAGELLEEPWPLSVITCPAANGVALAAYAPARVPQIPAAMTARTAKMLSVAAEHGVRRLILGAWGCGAYGLDVSMMADIFHAALTGTFRGVFNEIVFAILDWSDDRAFIGPFERRFDRQAL